MTENQIIQYNGDDDFADMRPQDVITPRLALMQPTSPLVIDGKYRGGQFIDTGAEKVVVEINKSTLILPVMMWLQWIEWNPDRSCPKDKRMIASSTDPRSELAAEASRFAEVVNSDGKKVFKVTEYYNFIVMLPEYTGTYTECFMTGFARSSHRVGKTWINRMSKLQHGGHKAPMWMHAWQLSQEKMQKDNNTFFVPKIGDAVKVPEDAWAGLNAIATEFKARKAEMAARAAQQAGEAHDDDSNKGPGKEF
jgi:hypothetical protein